MVAITQAICFYRQQNGIDGPLQNEKRDKPAESATVSVVVSIQMRKIFAEVRKMFSNARDAEQDVR